MQRLSGLLLAGMILLVASLLTASAWQTTKRDEPHTLLAKSAHAAVEETPEYAHPNEPFQRTDDGKRYAVTIRQPDGPPRIELEQTDPLGRQGSVACSTCHSALPPNRNVRSGQDLDTFHQGMKFEHGNLTCYACHDPGGADMLRLADGSSVEYRDVMTLCSQCHGPQATAFAHGAHGGMNGFWDLSRGPQQRNNCVDCHAPHTPSFPKMLPTFKPKDRFLSAESGVSSPSGNGENHDSL